MNNIKNIIIATLTGLLVLTFSMQSSDGASVKTYDALKLAQYEACVNALLNWDIAQMHTNNGNGNLRMSEAINKYCNSYKP